MDTSTEMTSRNKETYRSLIEDHQSDFMREIVKKSHSDDCGSRKTKVNRVLQN